MDPGLNSLLKWAVENSDTAKDGSEQPRDLTPRESRLDAAALQALMGGPTDADMMRSSMAAVQDPEVTLENKLVAFDNLEQLVESIDNANNLEPLKLWEPLIELLSSEEADLRRMAAWCIGTAVQNNPKSQAKLLELNAIPTLVTLSTSDPQAAVRLKAIYALSSEIRNFPPGFEEAVKLLPPDLGGPSAAADRAEDMEFIDSIISTLRERAKAL